MNADELRAKVIAKIIEMERNALHLEHGESRPFPEPALTLSLRKMDDHELIDRYLRSESQRRAVRHVGKSQAVRAEGSRHVVTEIDASQLSVAGWSITVNENTNEKPIRVLFGPTIAYLSAEEAQLLSKRLQWVVSEVLSVQSDLDLLARFP